MIERDLLGEPIPAIAAKPSSRRIRKIGYADKVGGGPKGKRCGQCKFSQKVSRHGQFTHKCELMAHIWAHTEETDISLRAPACSKFERRPYKSHASN